MKLIFLSLILVFLISGISIVNGILVGDGKEESDVILVGKVISFTENQTALDTDYVVQVEEYLKFPKNYDTTKHVITITSPGLRQYDDPYSVVIYPKLFNVGDRVLFLLYLKDGKFRESLWSLTTKSSCSPKQLLDEMYGASGLSFSQNNQTKHFYTNQPIDLTYYGYNRDLISEKKDFEFKVIVPKTGQILSEKRQLDFQECKRTTSTSWSFTPAVAGRYTFHAILGNNDSGSEAFSGFLIEDYVDSPLKQYRAGIPIEEIKCKEGLELIFKLSDNSPACVKPESKSKLIERGWARSDSTLIDLGPIDNDIVQKQTIILNEGIDDLDSGTSFHPIYKKAILGVNSTITWLNTKSEPVHLLSDENYFNVTIQPQESFSFTYDTVGVHRYHDPINWKRGSIMVSTEKMESSNLKPSKLLEKTPDEIAKTIVLAAINDDKITKKRLDNSIMSAYVTERGGDIIVPKSLCIICTNADYRAIQYRFGLTKPLIYPQDEVEGLNFAKEFMNKIGYHTDGTEWIDAVDFGSYIRVTLQQRVQGWIIPNQIIDFSFFRDNTSISLGRWYDDITSYQFTLSQEDAKIIAKDYMQKEVNTNPTLQKFQYEFQEINGAQVMIIDDKPVYVVPVSFKSGLQQKFENGHCGGPEYFTGVALIEGKTGSALGWDYPGCE